MTDYEAEDVTLTIGGRTYTIGGISYDPVYSIEERLWYKDVEGKPYSVVVTCEDYTQLVVSFTEEGYDKNIKHMKPTLKSPFKATYSGVVQ